MVLFLQCSRQRPRSCETFHRDVGEPPQLGVAGEKARASVLDCGGEVKRVQRFEPVLCPDPRGPVANGRRYCQHAHVGRLEKRDVLGQQHLVVRLQGTHMAPHAYQVADRPALTTRQQSVHPCLGLGAQGGRLLDQ